MQVSFLSTVPPRCLDSNAPYRYTRSRKCTAIRFGIRVLVHGSRGALQDPEELYDAFWERNLALVREAEQLGYDGTLWHSINPHHAPNDQLAAQTSPVARSCRAK